MTPRSIMNFFIHTPSFVAYVVAIYSTSMVESIVVVSYLELFKHTAPLFKVNTFMFIKVYYENDANL